jgi:hypothetical protein
MASRKPPKVSVSDLKRTCIRRVRHGAQTPAADVLDYVVCKPMEVTVTLRLLLISALFLFAQISTMQAQETMDLAKITCEQFMMEKLAYTSRDVVLLLTGYYNGKRNNTIIEPQTIKSEEEKVNSYCYHHSETTVMDAVKNVLGFDK